MKNSPLRSARAAFYALPFGFSAIHARVIRIVMFANEWEFAVKIGEQLGGIEIRRFDFEPVVMLTVSQLTWRFGQTSDRQRQDSRDCFAARLNALRQWPTLSESAVTKSRHAF
jgi:hypothetical protein